MRPPPSLLRMLVRSNNSSRCRRVLVTRRLFPAACLACHHHHDQNVFFSSLSSTSTTSEQNSHSHCSFSTAATTASSSNDTSKENLNIPFLLADIGEGIKEVELMQWFVQPGDHISQFDKVCEVQSDKATVEITSRFDGTVAELAGNVGDMMQVGEPLCYFVNEGMMQSSEDDVLEGGGESAAAAAAAGDTSSRMLRDETSLEKDELLHIPTVASRYHLQSDDDVVVAVEKEEDTTTDTAAKFQASPAVRKLAREYGIDPSTIHGSGPRGRLLKSDVMIYLREQGRWKGKEGEEQQQQVALEQPAAVATTKSPAAAAEVTTTTTADEHDEIIQLKGYNRLMIQSMTAALQIPHMCFGDEVVVDKLLECRQALKKANASNISLLTFLIKACSLALLDYPIVNAVIHDLDRAELLIRRNHNIGIAMDTPRGLVVPVIFDVQKKSLLEVQHDLDRLKALAQESKLSSEDLQNATITLSNIGSVGCGTYMQPVIVPPQICMGAIGQVQCVPRFLDENENDNDLVVVKRHILHMSWAGDHRVLDGATVARFHAAFQRYVQDPVQMLVQLR